MSEETIDRAPRASKTRSAKPRRQPWKPPSLLDAPDPRKATPTVGFALKSGALTTVKTFLPA